jgi:hypothetical protein
VAFASGETRRLPLYEVRRTDWAHQFVATERAAVSLPEPLWVSPGYYRLLWLRDRIAPFWRRDMLVLCEAITPDAAMVGRALCAWEVNNPLLYFGILQEDIHGEHWVMQPYPPGSLPVLVWPRTRSCRFGLLHTVRDRW